MKVYKLYKQYRTVIKFPNVYKSKGVYSLYANLISIIYNKSRLCFTCVPVWLHGYCCILLLGYENCIGYIYLEDFLKFMQHPDTLTSSALQGVKPLGRYCPLSWGDVVDSSIRVERKWQRDWEC